MPADEVDRHPAVGDELGERQQPVRATGETAGPPTRSSASTSLTAVAVTSYSRW
ncbi:hypothetical protein [Micromonospora zhanjiangensis]